jgi:uncharacterized metal-binding protein YceD (DUF177 family)
MCSIETFKIDLKGLKEGITTLEYHLDKDYFEAIDAQEVRRGELCAKLSVRRTAGFFELDFHIDGIVHIPCDLCLDDMDQAIDTDNKLVVKFGEEYSEDDDLVIVAEDEGILDVSWFIYEFIALDIPIKHVHAPGKCNAAMIKMLEEYSATRSSEGDGQDAVDSRWSELEKLKNNN